MNTQPNISQSWKHKFDLFTKIGADKNFLYTAMRSPAYKELSSSDKMKLSFNLPAFFFSALYYLYKGMWAKAAMIIGLTWIFNFILVLIESFSGFSIPAVIYCIPLSVVCAQIASYDYFRKVTQGEKMWGAFPNFFSTALGSLAAPVIGLILLFVVPVSLQTGGGDKLEEVSGVWRGDSDGAIITISLSGGISNIDINGNRFPVQVKSIDSDNNVITVALNQKGNELLWSLRQVYDDDGRFTLQMTLHDGTQDQLSFVRNL